MANTFRTLMKKPTSNKAWHVTVQHFGTKKTKVVAMPGGLHEAEAVRGAVLKAGNYWRPISAVLVEKA